MQERFEIGIIHKEELTETKIREANNRLSLWAYRWFRSLPARVLTC